MRVGGVICVILGFLDMIKFDNHCFKELLSNTCAGGVAEDNQSSRMQCEPAGCEVSQY